MHSPNQKRVTDVLPVSEWENPYLKDEVSALAEDIDTFSHEYDAYQYKDTVKDSQIYIEEITADIRSGESGHLKDFLQAVIEEGADQDDVVPQARNFLQRLSDYKPLAKVEELEEANYNMIDNVLNNEKPKKEQEGNEGRISVKEKLAEKRAELGQPGKQMVQEKEKKESDRPER